MAKITKQEFKNWSEDFSEKIRDFTITLSSQLSETEEEQLKEMRALIQVAVEAGDTFAIATFLKMVDNLTTKETRSKVYSDTGGLTLQQWLDNFKSRLKEHTEAGGYYKPNQPIDLPSLKERWKKLFKLWKNDEERKKVIPFLSDEDQDFVAEVVFFVDKTVETLGKPSNEDSKTMTEEYPFLVEDLCGRVEAAQKKLEQSEQNNNDRERERERERDNSHRPTIPNSPKQNNSQIEELKRQKQELETKNQKLEQQLANKSLSEEEKKIKEKELAANRKLLAAKDKELAKLLKQKPSNNTEKDNSKLNWAIGLGIAALVVGLLCFILLWKRRD